MLENKTKKVCLIKKTRLAETVFSRFKGLMFEKQKSFDYALVFVLPHAARINASIHMMFVFFPIDVLWLDEKKRVVDKREALAPFSLNATPKRAAKYIIELPQGKAEQVRLNDEIIW